MRKNGYAAIILAAGYSQRMGGFKPLLEIGGRTVTDRLVSSFLSNGVEVVLVTGWRGEELVAGIEHRGIQTVENPDYEAGMFTSIQAGVRRLSPHHRAFFIMPVDIPLVRPETIRRMLEHTSPSPDRVLHPTFCSRRGHPPLIPASLIEEILSRPNTGNLREVLSSHEDIATDIAVADRFIREDMDTKDDYARLLEDYRSYHIPSPGECEALFDIAGSGEDVRRHGVEAATVAVAIAGKLAGAGNQINIAEVRAGAVLHDIAEGRRDHHIVGAELLRDSGFGRIGDIVETHEASGESAGAGTLEAKVVFLADKLDSREAHAVSIKSEIESMLKQTT